MVIALNNYPYYYNGPCLMDDCLFLLIFINTVCMGKGTLASSKGVDNRGAKGAKALPPLPPDF